LFSAWFKMMKRTDKIDVLAWVSFHVDDYTRT
jgi:hypothetical protein